MPIEWHKIEEKWRKKWEEAHIFEANPDTSKPKYFLTVAYPYPNSPQHIGHGRTYTLADVHARYMRMKGYNVLFPMAFHYTGTPILAMAKRLANKDHELLDTFTRIYKVPENMLASLSKPLDIARYFHEEIKAGMKEIGYSMDWRREFTTVDPTYSKFIEWQFKKLHDKGLITQGSHPVGWCPNDGNPVGQHDTLGDIEPEIGEYTVIKFPFEDAYLPAATLRCETIFGVTNMWLNPEADYVKIEVDGEYLIVSKESAKKMEYLGINANERSRFKGSQLIGKSAKNPVTGSSLLILPATFVDPKNATGVVMSVPAHAPYDMQALIDLAADTETLREFNLQQESVKRIDAITIVDSEGYSENPAMELIHRLKVTSQDDPKLEEATSELYSHEFHKGQMRQSCGKYSGLPVADARDRVKDALLAGKKAFPLPEITNRPVVCRCGAECVVKIFENQWFINYGDKEWKRLAEECLKDMSLLPEDIRSEFEYTIGWLKEKACARKSGLGTPVPWEKTWIIESLSDSTIYMAYYVLAKSINKHKMFVSQLTEAFFDYVLLGKGDPTQVATSSRTDLDILEEIRQEFAYFYPLDSRHSGRDLVPNHLTFFIFNHSAIFPKENWPRQIVVNGSVLMDGKKMSKSFGNIVPLRSAIETYAADPLRLTIMATAELLQDADVSLEMVRTFRERLEKFYAMAMQIKEEGAEEDGASSVIDRWLLSRLQSHIASTGEAMEKLRVREAIHHCVYLFDQDIQWYVRRISGNQGQAAKRKVNSVLSRAVEARVRLLAPFTPHLCEEIWSLLGKDGFASNASWPQPDTSKIDPVAEEAEELVKSLLEDTQSIIRVMKVNPKRIVFYTAAKWKWKAYLEALKLAEEGQVNTGALMRRLMDDPEMKARAKEVSSLAQKLPSDLTALPSDRRGVRFRVGQLDEHSILRDAKDFFGNELEAEIQVYAEHDPERYDPLKRGVNAKPYRPAVYVE
ncbi:MAG: leucine--tRNA ligase [Thaumarchaeota archaeon]|nr:leucine--tRNA ligase [Nitrososphaerota archaeon]